MAILVMVLGALRRLVATLEVFLDEVEHVAQDRWELKHPG